MVSSSSKVLESAIHPKPLARTTYWGLRCWSIRSQPKANRGGVVWLLQCIGCERLDWGLLFAGYPAILPWWLVVYYPRRTPKLLHTYIQESSRVIMSQFKVISSHRQHMWKIFFTVT
ncbi:uncharacterized protein F5891DRAFT_974013 [Suillus fuscotomentosus]|uniref:Uncharacterized protein n=1 Tax=Suillus fuscotomentosus TaxID=1912939 RepID=A0AAD4HTW4_9AGAM|nr:uncharacterized protein F5891DRAFT_974013 [Suillus fuscotomentosus]KAG1908668.1 hypothetical protein F5891DRAFT_974013 [Suillus fuscotomentosus]